MYIEEEKFLLRLKEKQLEIHIASRLLNLFFLWQTFHTFNIFQYTNSKKFPTTTTESFFLFFITAAPAKNISLKIFLKISFGAAWISWKTFKFYASLIMVWNVAARICWQKFHHIFEIVSIIFLMENSLYSLWSGSKEKLLRSFLSDTLKNLNLDTSVHCFPFA